MKLPHIDSCFDSFTMSCGFIGGDSWYSLPEDFRLKTALELVNKNNSTPDNDEDQDVDDAASLDGSVTSRSSSVSSKESREPVAKTLIRSMLTAGKPSGVMALVVFLATLFLLHHAGMLSFNLDEFSVTFINFDTTLPGAVVRMNVTDIERVLSTYSQLWIGWRSDFAALHSKIGWSRAQALGSPLFLVRFSVPWQDEISKALEELSDISSGSSIDPEYGILSYQKDLLNYVFEVVGLISNMIYELEKIQDLQQSRDIQRWFYLHRKLSNMALTNLSLGSRLKPSAERCKVVYVSTFTSMKAQLQVHKDRAKYISKNFALMQAAIQAVREPMDLSHAFVHEICKAREEYIKKYSLPGFGLIKSTLYYYFFKPPGNEDWCDPEERKFFESSFAGLKSFGNSTWLALKYLTQTSQILDSIDYQMEGLISKLEKGTEDDGVLQLDSGLQDHVNALKRANEELRQRTNDAATWAWRSVGIIWNRVVPGSFDESSGLSRHQLDSK